MPHKDTSLRQAFSIGELSRQTSVHIETIRFYERKGIMPEPGRTTGGNRQYNEIHVKRLVFIKSSRDLGFSLDEITELLRLKDAKGLSCDKIHALAVTHIQQVKEKIARLTGMLTTLETISSRCSAGQLSDCPAIEELPIN